jgi:hypothetical protein
VGARICAEYLFLTLINIFDFHLISLAKGENHIFMNQLSRFTVPSLPQLIVIFYVKMLQQIISLALWLFVPQRIALLEILHKARLDCHALAAHVLKFGSYNLKFELFVFKVKQKEGN